MAWSKSAALADVAHQPTQWREKTASSPPTAVAGPAKYGKLVAFLARAPATSPAEDGCLMRSRQHGGLAAEWYPAEPASLAADDCAAEAHRCGAAASQRRAAADHLRLMVERWRRHPLNQGGIPTIAWR